MGLFDFIKQKLSEQKQSSSQGLVTDYQGVDDWETRDKYVRSLRRQVRRIQDEHEKKKLKNYIDRHEKAKERGWLTGDNILRHNTFKMGQQKRRKRKR